MASLTCPNCGKDNPDFLDNCQFCQTPLRREAKLNIGENPTKKTTGELEGVLPDWLRDARQQARDSAEEEAAKEAARPKSQKEEPLDLLAGLAFQAASDEEEVPDWLSAISPVQDKKTPGSSKPADEDQPSNFFAQFEGSDQKLVDTSPAVPMPGETAQQDEPLPWMSDSAEEPQKDELADWFSQTTAQSAEPFTFDTGETPKGATDNFNAPISQGPEQPEDLSWLRELEASTKQEPSAPSTSAAEKDWMSNLTSSSGTQDDNLSWLNNMGTVPAPTTQPESQPEDLSWLNNLGGVPLASEPASSQPASTEDDLSWLNNLGGTPIPAESQKEDLSWLNNLGGTPAEPASPQPAPAADDLSWLSNLGDTSAPAPAEPTPAQEDLGWLNDLPSIPATESSSPQSAPSADDMSWLNQLGGTPASTEGEASASQGDLSWLETVGGTPTGSSNELEALAQPDLPDWLKNMGVQPSPESAEPPQYSPRHTAPLSGEVTQEMPDWLKSATEASAAPSMPPLGAASGDWFASRERRTEKRPSDEVSAPSAGLQTSDQTQEVPVADTHQVAPADQNVFSAPSDSSLANQDVDALFAVDMPDWLSQPESAGGESTALQEEAVTSGGPRDELAPVDLPSWVQAMRPVEAVMGEAAAVTADQTTEREGPLAGLRGVIPLAPIGSAQRPKAISLKLQATAEQQASASLVEQILAGESTVQPLKVSPFISAQRTLRLGLAGLFLLVLGTIIAWGSLFMPISSALPAEVTNISNAIVTLPEGAPVLVVMDYEPSLAGEMEAASGPLLDQLVVLRKPIFTFIATSPNSAGLVERLLANTKISQPAPNGLAYQAGSQYINAGYLPGGAAGVRGFTEDPTKIMPSLLGRIDKFSSFNAVIVISDHAESGQAWIEQVTLAKQVDPFLSNQQLLVVASAQAGPMLRPYISSNQVTGMVSGIPDAARYEYVNNSRPGTVRTYWDAFGAGLFLAIVSIVIGSLWSLFTGIRARRAEAEPG